MFVKLICSILRRRRERPRSTSVIEDSDFPLQQVLSRRRPLHARVNAIFKDRPIMATKE